MSENTVQDLRKHLFDTIQALKDPANPMDIARAKAISNAAQVVVNSVKVEIDYMKLTGRDGTGFIPELEDQSKKPTGFTTVRQRSGWQNSR